MKHLFGIQGSRETLEACFVKGADLLFKREIFSETDIQVMRFYGSGTQLETMAEEKVDSNTKATRNEPQALPQKETTQDSPTKNEKRARKSSLKKSNTDEKMANGTQSPAQREAAKESQMHETFHDASAGAPSGVHKEAGLAKETDGQTNGQNVARSSTSLSGENDKDEKEKLAKQDLFPGDELLPDAVMVYDQKRTIRAPAEVIFPWLLQIGKNRGGWYLPLRIEGVMPLSWRPSRTIEPKWQKLTPGERIADYGFGRNDYFVVDRVIEPHTIVLRSKRYGSEFTWALLLRELHDQPGDPEPATVVHLRFRGKLKADGVRRRIIVKSGEVLDRLSAAPMLAGLAERCEQPGQLEKRNTSEKPARRSFAGLSSLAKPTRKDSSDSPKEETKSKRRSLAGLSPFSRSTPKEEAEPRNSVTVA